MDSNTTHSGSDKKIAMRTEEICCSYCTEKFASRMGLYHHFHYQHGINQAFRGYRVFTENTQRADLSAPSVAISGNNSSISTDVSQPEQTNEIGNDICMSEIKVETFDTNMPASTSVPSTVTTAASISPHFDNVINSASKVKVNTSQSDNSSTLGSVKFFDQTATSEPMQECIGQSTILTPKIKSVTINGITITPLLASTANDIRTTTKTLPQSRTAHSQQLEYSTNVSMYNQTNPNLYSRRYQNTQTADFGAPSVSISGNNSSISVDVSQPEQTNVIGNDTNMPASTSVPSTVNRAVSITPHFVSNINSASKVKINTSQSDNSSTLGSLKFVDQTATSEPMQVCIVGQSTILTPKINSVTNNEIKATPLLASKANDIHMTTKTLPQSRTAHSQQLEYSNVSMYNQTNPSLNNRRYQSFCPPSYASRSLQSGAPRVFNTSPAAVNIIPSVPARPHNQLKDVDSAEHINSEDEKMTDEEPLPSVTLHYMPAVGIFPGFNPYPLHYHPYDSTLRTSYLYNPNYRNGH